MTQHDEKPETDLSKGYAASVFLDDEAGVVRVIVQSVLALWEVVNDLTRLRPRRWRRFRVTIFGSARIATGTPAYEQVQRLAHELAAMGCDIVTGGGPGLMQAANEGAATARADDLEGSIGVRIQLAFEQETNRWVGQEFAHRTFFSRLHHFVLLSNAFIVVPGGVGTTLEAVMIWQLLQVRGVFGTPLICIGRMWSDLLAWAKMHMLRDDAPLADAVDMTIPRCVDDVDAALAIVREYHARWVAEQGASSA